MLLIGGPQFQCRGDATNSKATLRFSSQRRKEKLEAKIEAAGEVEDDDYKVALVVGARTAVDCKTWCVCPAVIYMS